MLADLRLALRALRRAPGFTLAAALCLALGVGATTAVLAVADAVLFRPLPVRGLDRIVVVRQDLTKLNLLDAPLDPPGTVELLARHDLFDAAAAYTEDHENLATPNGEPQRVRIASTVGDFFGLLEARAAAGRLYPPGASRDPGAQRGVVLGYAFWREHFGGDPGVVGRTIRLDGLPQEVVGVAGPSLGYPRGVDVYRPFPVDSSSTQQWSVDIMTVIGRVRPGVTPERLSAGLAEEADRWRAQSAAAGRPQQNGVVVRAVPLATVLAGELRPITRLLLGAVALVLLVACANVACLQLVRATGRARELAVRAAIGAGRAHLARPLAAESVTLAAGGGVLGVVLAAGALAAVRRWGPAQYPQLGDAHVDPRVLAGALAVAAGAALAFGLAPALRAVRADPQDALRGASRSASAGADRQRFLQGAVVTQVALALTLVLVLGAGLLTRSFARLAAADPGFRAEQVYTAHFGLPSDAYPTPAQKMAAFGRVLDRVASAPGVTAAALGAYLPMADQYSSTPFSIVGSAPDPGGRKPHAEFTFVTENYFRALGIPLRRGRAFTRADDSAARPVVIVDEQLAREFFPGQDPVGRLLKQLGDADVEIVGVVGTATRAHVGEARKALVYYPLHQKPWASTVAVVVRGALPPAAADRLVRTAVAEVDRQVPVYDARPMQDRVDESIGGRRLATLALGAFAGAALLLAALGVYGVLSYAVAQRARELGVRSALGAGRGDLERMVVGGGARLAAVGAVAGLLLFLLARRGLAALLYGVGPADPVALGVGTGVLAAAVLLASWIPARRAARVDPAAALRAE